MQGMTLGGSIVGIATTWDGRGYYLAGSDGSVYTFGDAQYYGSESGQPMSAPIAAIAVSISSTRKLCERMRIAV